MDKELNLTQILACLRQRIWLIILLLMLGAGAAFSYSYFFITPTYSTSVSIYVYNKNDSTTISQQDLTTSQKLVQTYIVILKSDTMLDSVSAKLSSSIGYKMTATELRNMITAAAIDSTEAFRVTVTHSKPETAQLIANTIADMLPNEIIRVVKAGAVEIIDYAKFPTAPSAPDIKRYTLIGGLIGIIIACGIAVIISLTDTKIHSDDDLTVTFGIPVLGVIPQMSPSAASKQSQNTYGERG